MPSVNVVDMHGKTVGSMELKDEIFAAPVNVAAMHLVVRSYLAAQRQGTQSALTRGEVRGGGRRSIVRRAPAMPGIMATALPRTVTAAWSSRPSPATM